MSQRELAEGPRPALALAATVTCAAAVGGSGKDALQMIGDTCIKDDVCQSGRCDEQRCIKKVPMEPDEPCNHPLECRSKNCDTSQNSVARAARRKSDHPNRFPANPRKNNCGIRGGDPSRPGSRRCKRPSALVG